MGANRRALPFTQPYKALKSKREKSNSKECPKSEIEDVPRTSQKMLEAASGRSSKF